jgi:hypothetical protein
VDGVYPNLEVYLQSLVEHIIKYQNEGEPPEDTTTVSNRNGSYKFSSDQNDVIQLYYDRMTSEILVKHNTLIRKIEVYSVSGVQIANQRFSSPEIRLKIPASQSGIFVLRIEDENNSIFLKKIPIIY